MSYELCISVIHYVMQHSVINSPIHSIIFYELCISVIISCSNVEGKGYMEL